jgi:hypothetical protein
LDENKNGYILLKDRGCIKMIKEEIKSNYLRVITDNKIVKKYKIPLDIEDICGNIKIIIHYLSNVNYGLKIKIFKENHEIFSGEVEGFFFRKVIIGNVFDAQLIILVEFYEEGFRKDLMVKIESMNFVSVDFNNENICRGEYYGD